MSSARQHARRQVARLSPITAPGRMALVRATSQELSRLRHALAPGWLVRRLESWGTGLSVLAAALGSLAGLLLTGSLVGVLLLAPCALAWGMFLWLWAAQRNRAYWALAPLSSSRTALVRNRLADLGPAANEYYRLVAAHRGLVRADLDVLQLSCK